MAVTTKTTSIIARPLILIAHTLSLSLLLHCYSVGLAASWVAAADTTAAALAKLRAEHRHHTTPRSAESLSRSRVKCRRGAEESERQVPFHATRSRARSLARENVECMRCVGKSERERGSYYLEVCRGLAPGRRGARV